MPKVHVSKSVTIQAPLDKVYDIIRDFRQWPQWSPWLITEPECDVTYADDGMQYSWEGRVVGSGEMAITEEQKPRRIDYNLRFHKPYKSQATVAFDFSEKDGGTEVSWSMDSSLPFFLFFLKKMMQAFVGMDYERGLNLLKDYVETGEVPCKLEFPGSTKVKGSPYIGLKTQCAIADIGPAMAKDFEKLRAVLCEGSDIEPNGKPFSLYHDWNPAKGTTEYTIGFPLESAPESPPDGFLLGEIPGCEAYQIKHTGPYRHLGNAWSAGFFRVRNKVIKQDKKIAPFEIYDNRPNEVPENELVTIVHFPLQAQ